MVKKSVLQKFIDSGGYETVHFVEEGAKGAHWQGVEEASKKAGLSRMTVFRLLKENPTQVKGQPKYVGEFEETEGFKRFKEKYGSRASFPDKARIIMEAYVFLAREKGHYIDPKDWTEEDYRIIWKNPHFKRPKMDDIVEQYGVPLRNLMKATGKTNLLLEFHSSKFQKGHKKSWYLEENDIIALTKVYDINDALTMLLMGIVKGARWSSLTLSQPDQLKRADLTQADYEPKMAKKGGIAFVNRFLQKSVMDFVFRYIEDYTIEPQSKMFKEGYSFYSGYMGRMGRKAGLSLSVSTHIMKHTFVTQAMKHGVSSEIISQQTGTDWDTLKQHYLAEDERKARHELQDAPYDIVSFQTWLNKTIMPHFVTAYDRIRKMEAQ